MDKFTVIVIRNDKELVISRSYRRLNFYQDRRVTPQYEIGKTEPYDMKVEKGSETLNIQASKEVEV